MEPACSKTSSKAVAESRSARFSRTRPCQEASRHAGPQFAEVVATCADTNNGLPSEVVSTAGATAGKVDLYKPSIEHPKKTTLGQIPMTFPYDFPQSLHGPKLAEPFWWALLTLGSCISSSGPSFFFRSPRSFLRFSSSFLT